jgi:hypothetical protein
MPEDAAFRLSTSCRSLSNARRTGAAPDIDDNGKTIESLRLIEVQFRIASNRTHG